MTQAALCLGSNINPQQHIVKAVKQLRADFDSVQVSNLYESKAVGFDGDNFLNVVVALNTSLELPQLIDYAAQLERQAGRVRVARGRFDSRTLDVDILLYDNLQGEHYGYELPNNDIAEFAHVLKPLTELLGDYQHPTLGISFQQLLEQHPALHDVWQVPHQGLL